MANVFDILTDDNNELLCINGDLTIGESTQQHVKHLMQANKNDYKQNPLVGIGADNFINDDDTADFLREIESQLEMDGAKHDIRIDKNGIIKVAASYE